MGGTQSTTDDDKRDEDLDETPPSTPPTTPARPGRAQSPVEVAAMDLTRDDRLLFATGTHEVNFLARDSPVQRGWNAKYRDGTQFTPSKLLLDNGSAHTVLLSPGPNSPAPGKRGHEVTVFDTERGTPVRSTQVKNRYNEDGMELPIADMVSRTKFGGLESSGQVLEHVAISGNMLFKLQQDLRVNDSPFVVGERAEIPGKQHQRYSCIATTADGHVAVGTNMGEVKLYTAPDDPTKPWGRAKTNIDEMSGVAPVTSIDVTRDGGWVLWTTDSFLCLLNVELSEHRDGRRLTGFEKTIPVEERGQCMLLKLSSETLARYGVADDNGKPKYKLTKGRFDNALDNGVLEQMVVCSFGEYICKWNMRQLKNDYKRCQQHQARFDTKEQPQLFTDSESNHAAINLYQPEYSHQRSVVIATANELARLELLDS